MMQEPKPTDVTALQKLLEDHRELTKRADAVLAQAKEYAWQIAWDMLGIPRDVEVAVMKTEDGRLALLRRGNITAHKAGAMVEFMADVAAGAIPAAYHLHSHLQRVTKEGKLSKTKVYVALTKLTFSHMGWKDE